MRQAKVTCQVISATSSYHGNQGFDYQAVISAQSVGPSGLCMHLLSIPSGGKARAHFHENHETAIYVLRGCAAMGYRETLEEHLEVKAGDFLYIPAGVPHLPITRAKPNLPLRSWHTPTPTNRKVSCQLPR
jgi:uncharacterized RmlC-like cupin family protein